jgi:hypothetical protein
MASNEICQQAATTNRMSVSKDLHREQLSVCDDGRGTAAGNATGNRNEPER